MKEGHIDDFVIVGRIILKGTMEKSSVKVDRGCSYTWFSVISMTGPLELGNELSSCMKVRNY
jgi:hypothetical protein